MGEARNMNAVSILFWEKSGNEVGKGRRGNKGGIPWRCRVAENLQDLQ